jgi:probable addiction module antidote protein
MKTLLYDPAEFLDDDEAMSEYLRLTCEDGTPTDIARALGAIARARGMSEIASKTGLARPALYKALSGEGNPEFATIVRVAEALGFRISLRPIHGPSDEAAA